MNVLCIGGVLHGQMVQAPDHIRQYRVTLPKTTLDGASESELHFPVEEYDLCCLCVHPHGAMKLLVKRGMPFFEVFEGVKPLLTARGSLLQKQPGRGKREP